MYSESYIYSKEMSNGMNLDLDSNNEMVSLGIVNMIASCLGCYPVFGSFVRNKLTKLIGANSQYF